MNFLLVLFSIIASFFYVKSAQAFECNIPVNGVTTIEVSVDRIDFTKPADKINLLNLANYVNCSGNISENFKDALRIIDKSAELGPEFKRRGVTGYFISQDAQYHDFSDSLSFCIWPDANCSTVENDKYESAMHLIVGIKNPAAGPFARQAHHIPAGAEIARFQVVQRGRYNDQTPDWGGNIITFILTTKNPINFPTYACTVDGDKFSVQLPPVSLNELRASGTGKFDDISKTFAIQLNCDFSTMVDITFDAATMDGLNNVIVNKNNRASSVGIQLYDRKTKKTITFGERYRIIDFSEKNERLEFDAFYFYNGGLLNPGVVNASAIVTFNYQ